MPMKVISGPYPQGSTPGEYEVVYINVYNNHSALIPLGGHVCYDPAATVAQNLGRAVTRPATANLGMYAGCAPAEIALGAWGLIVCFGVMEEMGQDGGTTDTASNQTLTIFNGTFYPHTPVAAAAVASHITVMEAVTTATGTGRGLIRAM